MSSRMDKVLHTFWYQSGLRPMALTRELVSEFENLAARYIQMYWRGRRLLRRMKPSGTKKSQVFSGGVASPIRLDCMDNGLVLREVVGFLGVGAQASCAKLGRFASTVVKQVIAKQRSVVLNASQQPLQEKGSVMAYRCVEHLQVPLRGWMGDFGIWELGRLGGLVKLRSLVIGPSAHSPNVSLVNGGPKGSSIPIYRLSSRVFGLLGMVCPFLEELRILGERTWGDEGNIIEDSVDDIYVPSSDEFDDDEDLSAQLLRLPSSMRIIELPWSDNYHDYRGIPPVGLAERFPRLRALRNVPLLLCGEAASLGAPVRLRGAVNFGSLPALLPYCEELWLQESSMSSCRDNDLNEMMQGFSRIRSLKLHLFRRYSSNGVTRDGLKRMLKAMCTEPSSTRFFLHTLALVVTGEQLDADILFTIFHDFGSLKDVSLMGCPFSKMDSSQFFSKAASTEFLDNCMNLVTSDSLIFHSIERFSITFETFFENFCITWLTDWPRLRVLELNGPDTGARDEDLCYLFDCCPCLEELRIRASGVSLGPSCWGWTESYVEMELQNVFMAERLHEIRVPRLKVLRLCSNIVDDNGLALLGSKCGASLRDVRIGCFGDARAPLAVSDAGLGTLASAAPGLERLQLDDTAVTARGLGAAAAICRGLIELVVHSSSLCPYAAVRALSKEGKHLSKIALYLRQSASVDEVWREEVTSRLSLTRGCTLIVRNLREDDEH